MICAYPKNHKTQKQNEVRNMKGTKTESWVGSLHTPKSREAEVPVGTSAGTYPLPRAPFTWVGVAETHTQTHPVCAHLGLTC